MATLLDERVRDKLLSKHIDRKYLGGRVNSSEIICPRDGRCRHNEVCPGLPARLCGEKSLFTVLCWTGWLLDHPDTATQNMTLLMWRTRLVSAHRCLVGSRACATQTTFVLDADAALRNCQRGLSWSAAGCAIVAVLSRHVFFPEEKHSSFQKL